MKRNRDHDDLRKVSHGFSKTIAFPISRRREEGGGRKDHSGVGLLPGLVQPEPAGACGVRAGLPFQDEGTGTGRDPAPLRCGVPQRVCGQDRTASSAKGGRGGIGKCFACRHQTFLLEGRQGTKGEDQGHLGRPGMRAFELAGGGGSWAGNGSGLSCSFLHPAVLEWPGPPPPPFSLPSVGPVGRPKVREGCQSDEKPDETGEQGRGVRGPLVGVLR